MSATLTNSILTVETAALDTVTVDLYRDVHKGLRSALFDLTVEAGHANPDEPDEIRTVGEHWHRLVQLLVGHAEHEDAFVQPQLERIAPNLAEVIARDHLRLEDQMAALELLADRAAESAPSARRILTHRLYLGLASFTSAYLAHQEFEELEVAVSLSAALTRGELEGVKHAIVASIPPEEMASALSLMLPAMNIDDQFELLAGMQAGAPPEAFAGVVALAESVLVPANANALKVRLGIA